MDISKYGATCRVIAHKYALVVEHPEIKTPFKIVVHEVLQEKTGESLGWIAVPEIQLRQTTQLKQEYIISNANPFPEQAVGECLMKMLMTESRDIYYPTDFEERDNRLWLSPYS